MNTKSNLYSEKASKFGEIFTLLLTVWTVDKSKVKISQNFVAFSEYTNFTCSKVSTKRPVLLNYLVWIFPKSLY